MLIVSTLAGEVEALTDYKELQIKRRVNGEYSLSFLLIATNRNEHSFPLVQEESIIEYQNQKFRIKKAEERAVGSRSIKSVKAEHIMFDAIDNYQYETLSGTLSIQQALNHALEGSPYTFDVVDAFNSRTFDNFGDDNSVSLLQKVLNEYGAEVDPNNNHLIIREKIGNKTDFQFRYKHNLKTISKSVDTSNLSTYIKGFGAEGIEAEYTSPMADIYGIRHAKPVRDERYTTTSGLLERLQKEIADTPDISFTIEFSELKKAGYPYEVANIGDEIFVIYEPLNIDITARILEYTEYPEEPRASTVTLANFKNNMTDIVADFGRFQKEFSQIVDDGGKVRYNVLDEAVKRATEALNNALTELEFTENMGIIARDPNDANRFLALRSNGLGITEDGGQTFREAITTEGFVLTAGAIGQLNANNINISGVVGAINEDDTLTFEASKVDLYGNVTFSMFDTNTQSTINSKADSSSLGSLAYNDLVETAQLGSTIIQGGHIRTELMATNISQVDSRLHFGSIYTNLSDVERGIIFSNGSKVYKQVGVEGLMLSSLQVSIQANDLRLDNIGTIHWGNNAPTAKFG